MILWTAKNNFKCPVSFQSYCWKQFSINKPILCLSNLNDQSFAHTALKYPEIHKQLTFETLTHSKFFCLMSIDYKYLYNLTLRICLNQISGLVPIHSLYLNISPYKINSILCSASPWFRSRDYFLLLGLANLFPYEHF